MTTSRTILEWSRRIFWGPMIPPEYLFYRDPATPPRLQTSLKNLPFFCSPLRFQVLFVRWQCCHCKVQQCNDAKIMTSSSHFLVQLLLHWRSHALFPGVSPSCAQRYNSVDRLDRLDRYVQRRQPRNIVDQVHWLTGILWYKPPVATMNEGKWADHLSHSLGQREGQNRSRAARWGPKHTRFRRFAEENTCHSDIINLSNWALGLQ